MRIHTLQHVSFEDSANIGLWAAEKGHHIINTMVSEDGKFPGTGEFDWLVIMGGPMNIYEEKRYPWLAREKTYIGEAIASGKTVLGICLGAQLVADVLGGRVYRNTHREIGWFPVTRTAEASTAPIGGALPGSFTAFHWHGDTFDIPPGCIHIAGSDACPNQAFEYDGHVLGLQFHLESSEESVNRLIDACGDELQDGQYVQNAGKIREQFSGISTIRGIMTTLLDTLEKR